MHGVPPDLDLRAFVRARLDAITLGAFIMFLTFDPVAEGTPGGRIGIEGEWQLIDPTGAVIDHDMEARERTTFRLHALVGQQVSATRLDPPRSFSLIFESGYEFRVLDTPHYESFSIEPAGIHI